MPTERERDMRKDLRINRDARFQASRIQRAEEDGGDILRLEGYASITNQPYQMYSFWGDFEEIVARGAFEKSLAANPKVILRFSHIGKSLAMTHNQTLELREDDIGLWFRADMDARRQDALDLWLGVDRGDIDECSFAGWIVEYTMNKETDDWTLNEIDLDRGDVAVVNFGANPHTSVGARAEGADRFREREENRRRSAAVVAGLTAAALPAQRRGDS